MVFTSKYEIYIMSRNSKTSIITSPTGKRRYASADLTPIPEDPNDIFIITTSVERLDQLAQNFYGNSSAWWIIALANNIGKGTIYVKADVRLRIPSKSSIKDIL